MTVLLIILSSAVAILLPFVAWQHTLIQRTERRINELTRAAAVNRITLAPHLGVPVVTVRTLPNLDGIDTVEEFLERAKKEQP